jgi:hypothetical protein
MLHACSNGLASELESKLPCISSFHETNYIGSWLVESECIERLQEECRLREGSLPCASIRPEYGFTADCQLISALPSVISAYLSFLPRCDQACLRLGRSDTVVVPLDSYNTGTHHSVYPNPLPLLHKKDNSARNNADSTEPAFLAVSAFHDAGYARSSIRRHYTKTWRAFSQVRLSVDVVGCSSLSF